MRCLSTVFLFTLLVQTVSGSNGTTGTTGTSAATTGSTSSSSTTGAADTVAKIVSGQLAFKINKTQCEELRSKAISKLKEKFANLVNGVTTSNIEDLTLQCGRRRLSGESRRLTEVTATLKYKIKVAAGSAINAATVQANVNALTTTNWKTIIEAAAAAAGVTGVSIDVSTIAITAATTANAPSTDTSLAGELSIWSLPLTFLLMAWKQY